MNREVVKVCLYDQSMAEAFDRFCRIIWPNPHNRTTGSSPSSKKEGGKTPREDAPTFVFVKGEDIVGHVTTIPVQISSGMNTTAAHWIVGFMVLPEHRNGLVGPLLIKEVNRALKCALSLHVEPPVLRILTGLKWVHRGVLPQYLRLLNGPAVAGNLQSSGIDAMLSNRGGGTAALPFRFVESFARWISGWGLTLIQMMWIGLSAVMRPTAASVTVFEERGFDESYDELWQAVRGKFTACVVRDRAYLEARFGRHIERYRVLACRNDSRLLGYCIIKTKQFANDPRMGHMKIGTILDCLFDPADPSVFQALLVSVNRMFDREGVHAVLCTASHALVRRLLLANGFLKIPGNLHFAYHNQTDVLLQDVPLESWHLMRGDSDADQNF